MRVPKTPGRAAATPVAAIKGSYMSALAVDHGTVFWAEDKDLYAIRKEHPAPLRLATTEDHITEGPSGTP
jgi:hypothetical protein